jgi:hypothetical protein
VQNQFLNFEPFKENLTSGQILKSPLAKSFVLTLKS